MIRSGEFGKRALRVTAWLMVVSAVVATVFGEWMIALQLGLIAAACKGALMWDGLERPDTIADVELDDDGG